MGFTSQSQKHNKAVCNFPFCNKGSVCPLKEEVRECAIILSRMKIEFDRLDYS